MSTIKEIHVALENGQNKDAVKMINEYGLYDFWSDYKLFLLETVQELYLEYEYFSNAVIVYNRITNR